MVLEKRVNIGLSETVHTQAKLISVVRGITLNDYFRTAIEEAISKDKEDLKKILK
jgi:hypothetical protein